MHKVSVVPHSLPKNLVLSLTASPFQFLHKSLLLKGTLDHALAGSNYVKALDVKSYNRIYMLYKAAKSIENPDQRTHTIDPDTSYTRKKLSKRQTARVCAGGLGGFCFNTCLLLFFCTCHISLFHIIYLVQFNNDGMGLENSWSLFTYARIIAWFLNSGLFNTL